MGFSQDAFLQAEKNIKIVAKELEIAEDRYVSFLFFLSTFFFNCGFLRRLGGLNEWRAA